MARSAKGVDISVIGVPALQRKLKRLRITAQKKIVRQALRTAAKTVVKPVADANIAAVSPGQAGTGALRRYGTRVRAQKARRRSGSFGVEVQTPTREQLNIDPGHAYYPAILEFGDSERGIEPKRMLRKAAEEARSAAILRIAQEIRRGIEAAASRIGGRK